MTSVSRRPIDVDAEAALAALKRARKEAEHIAAVTGTRLAQNVDGKPALVAPPPEPK
jgi:hypothetical protein